MAIALLLLPLLPQESEPPPRFVEVGASALAKLKGAGKKVANPDPNPA